MFDDVKSEYDEKGYAKIKGVFSQHEVLKIKEEAYKCLSFKDRLQMKGDRPALLFWPQDVNPYLREIAHSPKLVEIAKYFLGDKIRHLNNQIYFRESGDNDEFAWHQDICFRTPASEFSNIESKYLQTIIVVDEMTKNNGAIEFLPGTHTLGNLNLIPRNDTEAGLRKFMRGKWNGEKVEANPGDVIVWSVMVVHGSEKNESGRSRMNYMNGFAAEEAVLNKKRFRIYDA